jgi:outer membrane immunogenic protein
MRRLLLCGFTLAGLAVGPAMAADMKVKAPILKAPPPAWSWAGFHIGLNVGGKWDNTSGTVNEAGLVVPGPGGGVFNPASLPIGGNSSTLIGGGQVGYDWQTGSTVFGIEGDIDAQHWSQSQTVTANFPAGTFNFVPGDTFTIDSRWEASLRGRIGYAWDRVLLYATGGVTWTNVAVGTNFVVFGASLATSASDSATLTGATAGGGFAYAITNNVSLGVEGRYNWYGTHTFNGGVVNVIGPFNAPVAQSIQVNTGEVIGKVNFKF